MSSILIGVIRLYRLIGSWLRLAQIPGIVYTPCKFHPTCSEYAELAIKKYGPLKGSKKAFARILRCRPYAAGGVDYP